MGSERSVDILTEVRRLVHDRQQERVGKVDMPRLLYMAGSAAVTIGAIILIVVTFSILKAGQW